jgi:hypothetical protein
MIQKWFSQDIEIPLIPTGMSAKIIGLNDSEDPKIHNSKIILEITDTEGNAIDYVVYSHVVRTISTAYPTAEEIYDRYQIMVSKYIKTYSSIKFGLINFKKFKINNEMKDTKSHSLYPLG